MRFVFLFLVSVIIFSSCSSDNESTQNKDGFIADTLQMDPIFYPFEDETIPVFLEEARLCRNIPKDSLGDKINMFDPPCMGNFYKVFKFNDSEEYEDAFGVVIARRVHDFPLRRTVLFVKEKGKYIMMNRFVGDIVETRSTKNGYKDLLIRHRDIEAGSFAIKYVYQDGKYQPEIAEEINDALILKSKVDSLSPIIIDRVVKKKMFQ